MLYRTETVRGAWPVGWCLVLTRKSTLSPPARLAVLGNMGMRWSLWPRSLPSTRPLEGGEHIASFVPLISVHWLPSVAECMGLPRSPAAHLDLGPGIFPLKLRGHHYPSCPLPVDWPSDYIAAADITRFVQVFSAHDAGRNAEVVSFAPGGILRVSPKVIHRHAADEESLADDLARAFFMSS